MPPLAVEREESSSSGVKYIVWGGLGNQLVNWVRLEQN